MNITSRWPKLVASLGFVVGLAACSSKEEPGNAAPKGSGELSEARAVGQSLAMAFDAQPAPAGDAVYFTGMAKLDPEDEEEETKTGALYRLATGANSTPELLASGFASPFGLVLSTKADTIYVSDTGVHDVEAGKVGGVIYAVAANGGTPSPIASTQGYRPRAMDVREEGGADQLYFSGNDPADGKPGVFKLAAAGGAVSVVAKGEPLSDPSGIALASNGKIYVADTSAASGRAAVLEISGAPTELVGDIKVGYPAGIALTQDESFLLVSGHEADSPQAAVYRVEIASAAYTVLTAGIEGKKASGGIHRAKDSDTYAWADGTVGNATVFLLGTKAAGLR